MSSLINSFRFNKSQQIGIILLFIIILLLQTSIFLFDHFYPHREMKQIIPPDLQKQYDSLKKIRLKKKKTKIYPFNPNYITEYKAYFLGIDLSALQKIQNYRSKGRYFQSKQEFKQVSGISDSLFQALAPYINIPHYKSYPKTGFKENHKISNRNINNTTAEDLQTISGIGPVLSKRIIKYRESMGGFSQKEQINNVYGLDPEVIKKLWKVFYLPNKNKSPILKKAINSANIEDLKLVNGIGDKLAQRIIRLRDKNGGFTIKKELNTVYGLKPEVVPRVWQLFEIKNPKKITHKISLNDSNIKELSAHPYIDYSLAKKIVSYRTLHGGFTKLDDIKKVENFPIEKYEIIILYLKLD
jgi:competence ComEA-like helix-hairpin-helix protein